MVGLWCTAATRKAESSQKFLLLLVSGVPLGLPLVPHWGLMLGSFFYLLKKADGKRLEFLFNRLVYSK